MVYKSSKIKLAKYKNNYPDWCFEKEYRIFSKNTKNPVSIERLYKYEQS